MRLSSMRIPIAASRTVASSAPTTAAAARAGASSSARERGRAQARPRSLEEGLVSLAPHRVGDGAPEKRLEYAARGCLLGMGEQACRRREEVGQKLRVDA